MAVEPVIAGNPVTVELVLEQLAAATSSSGVRAVATRAWDDGGEIVERKFDRVTFDPQVMGSRACIRGMRIPVSVIVGQIAHGASFDEVLEGYPDLQREDIQQAIGYAAWLAQEQVYTS